jgi:hypothetical protein
VKRRPPPSIGVTGASSPIASSPARGHLQRCEVKNERREIERKAREERRSDALPGERKREIKK